MMDGNALLTDMKVSRDKTSSLRYDILAAKSFCDVVIVIEGVEDFSVYGVWLERLSYTKNYGHITAKGKKNIIDLYNKCLADGDEIILSHVKFIVDKDYDLASINNDVFLTLNSYSIENTIVDELSVKSFLKREFNITAGHFPLLEKIMNDFIVDFSLYNKFARIISKKYFLKHNLEGKGTYKFEVIKKTISIKYQSIEFTGECNDFNFSLFDKKKLDYLSECFDRLTDKEAIRGKYCFEFIKEWLNSLRNYLKTIDTSSQFRLNFDPRSSLSNDMSKFAIACEIPREFIAFFEGNNTTANSY
ncbi:DUF4435 domain-containing protein [Providencia sp. PROV174]|uniref:DUF4435 domain-containing protein n=1 Tax=Providencia sp. PROV174 TaxID=2949877 RepID=UPI0023496D8B|nr:DUF4435 domain-containing protein [Providencia sp. PROV174]